MANQIDLICVPQLTSAEGRLAAQNGGDALAMDVEPGSLTVTASLGEQRRIADLACPSIGVGP